MDEKYQEYLCSTEWASKRLAVLRRARNTCEQCKSARATQVHHLTYARKYREELKDLIALCEGCHSGIHRPKQELEKDISVIELQKVIARARRRQGL